MLEERGPVFLKVGPSGFTLLACSVGDFYEGIHVNVVKTEDADCSDALVTHPARSKVFILA
jgi:lipocalin